LESRNQIDEAFDLYARGDMSGALAACRVLSETDTIASRDRARVDTIRRNIALLDSVYQSYLDSMDMTREDCPPSMVLQQAVKDDVRTREYLDKGPYVPDNGISKQDDSLLKARALCDQGTPVEALSFYLRCITEIPLGQDSISYLVIKSYKDFDIVRSNGAYIIVETALRGNAIRVSALSLVYGVPKKMVWFIASIECYLRNRLHIFEHRVIAAKNLVLQSKIGSMPGIRHLFFVLYILLRQAWRLIRRFMPGR